MNNISNANEKQQEKQIIPDQLNITIRTSIPGYQKIEYKPSMTIKDSDSKGVEFNPMIRLNKSIIDRMPSEYRTKQFFNKGLFQSLLIHNGGKPAKSLLQATRAGYVDNNIKVTLDAIFPVNSVIYIGKKPYAIGDTQWTTGDWKIEVKQKREEIDPSKITDPQLYTQLVREEIISGEEQLSELPESLVIGNNYSGPLPVVAKGVKTEPTAPVVTQTPMPNTVTVPPRPKPMPNAVTTVAITPRPAPMPNIGRPKITPQIIEDVQPEIQQPVKKEMLALPPPLPESPAVEAVSPEEERIFESLKGKYRINIRNTMQLRTYFLDKNYYNIANGIYLGMSQYTKTLISNLYKLITIPKREAPSKSLSKSMYTASCNLIKVTESVSDGDCFFVAVAYGINVYNYENPLKKFYYQNYGKTQLYTATFLREIVLKYYEGLSEERKQELMMVVGSANVHNLNEKFKKSIEDNPPLDDIEYVERLEMIYKSDDNFFVLNPNRRPPNIGDDTEPFKLLTPGQIPSYIKSKNYWGDQFAIEAICNILKIYIIPINVEGSVNNIKLFARPAEPDTIKNICSNNIMFLYRKNLHYELITFKYKEQVKSRNEVVMKIKSMEKSVTIFKNGDLPPLFQVLILIYGSNYVTSDDTFRKKYGLYPEYMESINDSIKKIIKLQTPQARLFINLFNSMFKLRKSLEDYISPQPYNLNPYIENGDEEDEANASDAEDHEISSGGAMPFRSPYGYQRYNYSPYGYRPQYNSRYITKKPEELGASKIAYGITIDMELHPGTSLSPEQINESKCNSRYNAIRKAFSEFTGRPYVISPVYKTSETKKKIGGKINKITRKRH